MESGSFFWVMWLMMRRMVGSAWLLYRDWSSAKMLDWLTSVGFVDRGGVGRE